MKDSKLDGNVHCMQKIEFINRAKKKQVGNYICCWHQEGTMMRRNSYNGLVKDLPKKCSKDSLPYFQMTRQHYHI